MKNEIQEYLKINKELLPLMIDDLKNIMTNKIYNIESNIFDFINILDYIISEKLTEEFFNILNSEFEDINNINVLKVLLTEEKDLFLEFVIGIKKNINNNQINIIDLEWKFVGLIDINSSDLRDMNPKIFLKLIFSNQTYKLIETNYSNLKKLQEEMEDNLSSFNSVYSKRVFNFSK